MSKVLNIAAGLAVVPMLAFSAPVYADSPGDLAQGADIYQTRNVTKNGSYASSASAVCNDVVRYSVKLSNTDYSTVKNINIKASLTSGAMTATGTASNGQATSTSGTVNVSVAANSSLNYIEGSTKVYDINGKQLRALSDGVTANGVNAGDLAGSTRQFVQFDAKLDCKPTEENHIKVCDLKTKQVVTIKESEFNSSKHSKDLSKCVATPPTETPSTPVSETPEALPSVGAGQTIGLFALVSAAAAVAYAWVLRRQNAR